MAPLPNRFAVLSSVVASTPFFLLGYEVVMVHGLSLIEKSFETPHSEFADFEDKFRMLVWPGALIGGLLINYDGRRWPFAFGLVLYIVGSAALSFGSTFKTYEVGRVFMALGVAVGVVIGPISIAELSPAGVRGFLGSFPQLLFCLGRLSGYTAQYTFLEHPLRGRGWRVMTGTPCVLAFISLATLVVGRLRESPAYLPIHGKLDDSRAVMEADMGSSKEEADQRLDQLKKVANIPAHINRNTDHYHRGKGGIDGMWTQLFNVSAPATVLLCILHILHQLSGEFVVLTYTRPVLAGLGDYYSEEWYLFGLVALAGARLAGSLVLMLVVDWFGRRKMMLVSNVTTMVAAAILGVVGIGNQHGQINDHTALRWLAWGGIAYEAGLSVGLGGIIWMYGPESIGLPARAMAVVFAVMLGQEIGEALNTKVVSIYGQSFTRAGGSMLISVGFLLVTTVLSFAFLKDTSRKPLTDYEPSLDHDSDTPIDCCVPSCSDCWA